MDLHSSDRKGETHLPFEPPQAALIEFQVSQQWAVIYIIYLYMYITKAHIDIGMYIYTYIYIYI